VICPYCGAFNDKVIDSRASDGGAVIRRRRECLVCSRRFTTYERVEKTARLMVVKKDGSRVPFNGENILKGVQASCGKRPVSEESKLKLVHDVEEQVQREFDREVPSAEIGKRVAIHLRDLDEVAYVRFAIEHYKLETLDDLAAELSELRERPRNLPNQQPLFGTAMLNSGESADRKSRAEVRR
jgi:transcriptional repressor NrdR